MLRFFCPLQTLGPGHSAAVSLVGTGCGEGDFPRPPWRPDLDSFSDPGVVHYCNGGGGVAGAVSESFGALARLIRVSISMATAMAIMRSSRATPANPRLWCLCATGAGR